MLYRSSCSTPGHTLDEMIIEKKDKKGQLRKKHRTDGNAQLYKRKRKKTKDNNEKPRDRWRHTVGRSVSAGAALCCPGGSILTIEELTRLFANLHDGTPGPHLGHDAAGSPHVNWGTVVPLAKEQFGRTIPERDHAVRVPGGS